MCSPLPGRRKQPIYSSAAPTVTTATAVVAAAAAAAAAAATVAAKMRNLTVVSTSIAGVGEPEKNEAAEQLRGAMGSLVRWVTEYAKSVLRTSQSQTNVCAFVLKRLCISIGIGWLISKSSDGMHQVSSVSRDRTGTRGRSSSGGSTFRADVETLYPRPQSTAYPRPQSPAFPRPRVTVPTLLQPEPEEETYEMIRRRARGAARDGNLVLTRFLCWFFEQVITNRAREVEGLEVQVNARSNREAMSGLLQAVGITFNHLRLDNLEISGGATLRITGLDLKVRTLLWHRFRSFKKPFEVSCTCIN